MGQWALLVGVNYYGPQHPEYELQGCVADVQNIHDFLSNNPAGINCTLLTSSKPDDPAAQAPPEDSNSVATVHNFRTHLRRIELSAQPGDNVYIHYAAHGSETDGDVLLTFFDTRRGLNTLHGKVLAHHLKSMVDKGLLVSLVLDCCFSGATKRNAEDGTSTVRYIEYNNNMNITSIPEMHIQELRLVHRKFDAIPQWIVCPDGYTTFCACQADEEAKELEFDLNQKRGALSYFLLEAINRLSGAESSLSDQLLHQHLYTRFHARVPGQTPMRYGNKCTSFFTGLAPIHDSEVVTLFEKGGEVWLNKGSAHGVLVADEYSLFQMTETVRVLKSSPEDQVPPENLVIATVCDVKGVTSRLSVPESHHIYNEGVAQKWLACPRSHVASHNLPVRLVVPEAEKDQWLHDSSSQRFLKLYGENDNGQHCRYRIVSTQTGYLIQDESFQQVPDTPSISHHTLNSRKLVLDILEHMARYSWIEQIENRKPNPSLRDSITVRAKSMADGYIEDQGILRVKDKDTLVIEIMQRSNEKLYAYFLV